NGRLSVSGEAAEAKAGSSGSSQLQRSSSSSSLDGLTTGKRKLANRRTGLGGLRRSHSSDSLKSNSSTSSSRSTSSISSDKMKAGVRAAVDKIKTAANKAKTGMEALIPPKKGSKDSNSAEGSPLSKFMGKVKDFAEKHKPHTDKNAEAQNSGSEMKDTTPPIPPRPRTRANSDPALYSGTPKHSDLRAELASLNASLDKTLDKVQKDVDASLERSGVTVTAPPRPKPRPRTRANSDPGPSQPKHSELRAELESLNASLDQTLDKVQKDVDTSLKKSGVTVPTHKPTPRPRTRANSDPGLYSGTPKRSDLSAELQKLNASLDKTLVDVQKEVDASLERSGVKSPSPRPRTRANSDPGLYSGTPKR
ncbi:hypothetical protein, partial [Candidatus Ichthyocystis hellenicum]|uniref:hypothetical protein n=1 Tax=Candidatus Ichthyocystis hellenicum TaxID=1561003 RepID=UPI001F5FB5E8